MDNLVLSSSTLIGTDVKNPQGENLGSVKDVMIDINSGRVAYLVLSFGGFLGIGNKYFAIPLESFKVDSVDEKLILNIEKERLENAPGFDKDDRPHQPQREFVNEVYSYYGYGSFSGKDKTDELVGDSYTNPNYRSNATESETVDNRSSRVGYEENIFRSSSSDYDDNNLNDRSTRNRDLDPDRKGSMDD